MARPHKCRRISRLPDKTYFKPAGIPLRHLRDVNLTLDEYEALRLADLEKKSLMIASAVVDTDQMSSIGTQEAKGVLAHRTLDPEHGRPVRSPF